jgi:hypothetical protein
MGRRDNQGQRISELVTVMVSQLNAYTGKAGSKPHYAAFRDAKRELYKLRPDLAPGIMKFVLSKTHWGSAGPSGFAELQAQRQREATAKREKASKGKRPAKRRGKR